ncbi:unnamed protein product [Penicillium salamii]|uniref:F-box domain-containing protein n=1 Tax=Penicillium salamii TaxID=1612424 RepID=A0A9W4JY92_9EURO|nr:unnamed protein product [Penicillium salamii]CAG8152694.1 unnamed protein product [Penicillium salamii]CAG8163405.1 unnamed protein product [Penicillium salamii]CAG8312334.1 unnamed protein product [Penicillium salamii]CAG8375165.1 unnamed protein product [Penicillium salamii]
MAGATLDWADKPNADLSMSSDEEESASSQSAEMELELDSGAKPDLALELGKLQLKHEDANQAAEQESPLTPRPSQTPLQPKAAQPLQLLELPLDVLKEIIKEVVHTNDLTSLALTCSALHALAIPHMYSRFDIVWPESLNPPTDDYSGVDALSYGLSTLVMGEDVFNRLPLPHNGKSQSCHSCGCDRPHHDPKTSLEDNGTRFRSRRGNHYAQYTRTFSIGNGPIAWVQEYSVTKEVGKMLGTLVALAVARMVNLEAFVWDMPTGVVREIWLALASLADRPGHDCRLERIWVRWHDNSENALRSSSAAATRLFHKYKHVEHPSLSVLPPLKSIAVLDIDEPAYVEELALLIEKSRRRLTELRIGIANQAYMKPWLLCGKDSEGTSNWPKANGILGILTRQQPLNTKEDTVDASSGEVPTPESPTNVATKPPGISNNNERPSSTEQPLSTTQNEKIPPSSGLPNRNNRSPIPLADTSSETLNLKVLELERVPLSVSTLLPAIDWTKLTTLTIMRCEDNEKLWRALRRKYAPPVMPTRRNSSTGHRESVPVSDFSLNLKHIRTDTVSPYLMLFIKDALAPNTLESVFLHEGPGHDSTVHIDAIYRHVLRRHRQSLRKVLIDASDRANPSSPRAHKWMLNHDMIGFVTSGKMLRLKELGMSMHYRDWHYFLQRLPSMPQLRALYLPHIHHTVHRDLKELALQVLDIVSIRPDLKIAYIGLQTKCYQILEARSDDNPLDFDDNPTTDHSPPPTDDEDEEWVSPQQTNDTDDSDGDYGEGDLNSSDSEVDEEQIASRIRYRLQQILFYDEKVSIFKARHGVL